MSNHNIRVDAIGLASEVVDLRNEIARLKGQTNWVCQCGGTDCKGQRENAELHVTLDAIIAADERAVKLWRAAHPGSELVIPDRAKLVGWLLEQNDALRKALADMPTCRCGLSTDEQSALSVENAALRELVGTLGASNHMNVPTEQWRELRKDKERLDWMASADYWVDIAVYRTPKALRAAIDAARKEAQP